jgi:hypothetical protein
MPTLCLALSRRFSLRSANGHDNGLRNNGRVRERDKKLSRTAFSHEIGSSTVQHDRRSAAVVSFDFAVVETERTEAYAKGLHDGFLRGEPHRESLGWIYGAIRVGELAWREAPFAHGRCAGEHFTKTDDINRVETDTDHIAWNDIARNHIAWNDTARDGAGWRGLATLHVSYASVRRGRRWVR